MLEEAKRRYKICQACPMFRPGIRTCASCGCFLPAKVMVPVMHCPEKKW